VENVAACKKAHAQTCTFAGRRLEKRSPGPERGNAEQGCAREKKKALRQRQGEPEKQVMCQQQEAQVPTKARKTVEGAVRNRDPARESGRAQKTEKKTVDSVKGGQGIARAGEGARGKKTVKGSNLQIGCLFDRRQKIPRGTIEENRTTAVAKS